MVLTENFQDFLVFGLGNEDLTVGGTGGRVQFYDENRLHGEGKVLVQRALWSGKGKGSTNITGKYKWEPEDRNGKGPTGN